MVEIVEQLVEFVPGIEPRFLGQDAVIPLKEPLGQSEDTSDAKIVLVVPIK